MKILKGRLSLLSGAVVTTLVLAPPVAAQVLDFDALTSPDLQDIGTSYDEDGFRVTIAPDPLVSPNAYLLVWGSGDNLNADPGGATLTTGFSGNIVTVRAISGEAFRFDRIDLADAFNGIFSGSDGDIAFEFALQGGGTQTLTVSLADMPGLQRFTFGVDVMSVRFQGLTTRGQWVQFDTIVLNGAGGVVPEPATWAMLVAGFGAVGGALRRNRPNPRLATRI